MQEVSEVSRGLKSIAKELDLPVLPLSQLRHEVEKREERCEPEWSLANLRHQQNRSS